PTTVWATGTDTAPTSSAARSAFGNGRSRSSAQAGADGARSLAGNGFCTAHGRALTPAWLAFAGVAVVKTPFASKGISQPLRRRIDLAIAVAQERLLSTHVEHALELIELVGDQVPFDDALDIYTRLLRLTEDEARIITTRALAYLGEDHNNRKTWPERMAEADEAAKVNRARFGIIGNLRH